MMRWTEWLWHRDKLYHWFIVQSDFTCMLSPTPYTEKMAMELCSHLASIEADFFLQRRREPTAQTSSHGHLYLILLYSLPLTNTTSVSCDYLPSVCRFLYRFPSQRLTASVVPHNCYKEGRNGLISAQHLTKIQTWCMKINMKSMKKSGLVKLVSPSMHPRILIPFVNAGATWKAFLPQFQTFFQLVPFFFRCWMWGVSVVSQMIEGAWDFGCDESWKGSGA